jgi:hypothetical protein
MREIDVRHPAAGAVRCAFAEAIARAETDGEPVVVDTRPDAVESAFFSRIVGSGPGQILSIVREITEQKQQTRDCARAKIAMRWRRRPAASACGTERRDRSCM